MKNKVLKMVIIMLLIIVMTMSDFIFVGMNLVSYAVANSDNTTSHDNVKFTTYFRTENGQKTSEIGYQINSRNMKLYMEITVQNEGYFDGVVTLEDSNFNLKQDILGEGISKIEGNTISLNRVGAGSTVEIEVGLEPIIEESYGENMLNKESVLKLSGTYKDSTEQNISINGEKKVTLNLLVPSEIDTTLGGGVITNKIYKIGEANKRLVQLELNSSVVQNVYPIKSTTFELAVPEGLEDVEVISQGTYATNGEADKELNENFVLDTENNILKVAIENTSKAGRISWKKEGKDSVVITLILSGEQEFGDEKYSVKSKVEFYGKERKSVEKEATYNLKEEADGIIRTTIENDENIYKGKIYSREEREYSSITNIEINYANLLENASVQEKTTYKIEKDSADKSANIQYISTIISKKEVDKILGQEGKILIKDQNGNVIKEIVKDTETDENGNITITYAEGVNELIIEITKAIETGIIRLNHTKVIKAENYTREEITGLKYLVEKAKVTYNSKTYNYGKIKALKETKTVAELTVIPQTLSTATVNEQVKIGVTLRSDSEEYDLYKNPTIKVKLPDYIKNIEFTKATPLYLENMQISSFMYLPDTKEIEMKLLGEQTKYNSINTNIYIEILANIELDETMPNRQDLITLTFTNENAVIYENNGIIEVPVNISGHNGLLAFNSILESEVKTNSVTSNSEQIANLKMGEEATEETFQIALVNNTGSDLQNVKILGNLPVDGGVVVGNYTFNNTIGATLKSGINIQNGTATVYYTENRAATNDLQNSQNGWTTNLAEVANPVLYMLIISNFEKETTFIANYTMNIPANLEHGKDLKSTYVVNYDSNSVIRSTTANSVDAVPVGLETGKVAVTLEASVGTDVLKDGDIVKSGEIIRYKITVENTGGSDATNVNITARVPEGTKYIEFVEKGEVGEGTSLSGAFYQEREGLEKKVYNIGVLKVGDLQVFEYEVRVKNELAIDTVINQAIVNYNDGIETESNILTNILEEGEIKVTIEKASKSDVMLIPEEGVQYVLTVENLSANELKNIEVELGMSDEMNILWIEQILGTGYSAEAGYSSILIDSLLGEESKQYMLYLQINELEEQTKQLSINSIAKWNNKIYRSNAYYETAYGLDVSIEWEVSNEGEYLKPGNTIEYKITVTNNSIIRAPQYSVYMKIPNQLMISKLEVDGVEQIIFDKNEIDIEMELDVEETKKIKVIANVLYNPETDDLETISSVAILKYIGIEVDRTETVVHYIEPEKLVRPDNPEEPTEDPNEPPVYPENPDEPSVDPDNPDDPSVDPDNPDDPSVNPDNPGNPSVNPDNPQEKRYNISGKAWVDRNKDGEMNEEDTVLQGIQVKLLDVETNKFVRNEEGKDLIIETSDKGNYMFTNVLEGNYIVVFEYDKTLYKPTTYEKEGVLESKNSNVIAKTLTINGQEKEYATTNKIDLNKNITNIDMGLVFIKQFDIKVDKCITKVIVQTSKETLTYDYQNEDFAKVEIHRKRMVGSNVLVQYTIKITNTGDIDAYVNSLVDYVPDGLKFSSELNQNWYESKGNLYTNIFEFEPIAPGESREVNLILTKTKTDGNAELINNMAEINEAYNIYGIGDTNSIHANKNKDENDLGSADLMISIQTGSMFNYVIVVISMLGIIAIAVYLINKKVLLINFKERR